LARGDLGPIPEDPACTIICGGYATLEGRVALSGLIYCPNQPVRRLLARRVGARFVSEPPLRKGATPLSLDPRALKLELQGPSQGLLAPFLIDFDLDGKLDIPAGDGYVRGADLKPQELSIPSLMCGEDD
jgi:hypothetical protein